MGAVKAIAVHLVSRDLNARARLLDAGFEVTHGSLAGADAGADAWVLDLDEGGAVLLEELDARPERPSRVLGFISHIDSELMEAARAAGVQPVPRGRFWRDPGAFLSV